MFDSEVLQVQVSPILLSPVAWLTTRPNLHHVARVQMPKYYQGSLSASTCSQKTILIGWSRFRWHSHIRLLCSSQQPEFPPHSIFIPQSVWIFYSGGGRKKKGKTKRRLENDWKNKRWKKTKKMKAKRMAEAEEEKGVGRHSTEVVFALPTQQSRVPIPALLRFFL